MKKEIIALLLFLIPSVFLIAETEPNNSCAQANTISFNGSISGEFGTKNDFDYYTVYIPASGAITVSIQNSDPNVQLSFSFGKDCINSIGFGEGKAGESVNRKILISEAGNYTIFIRNVTAQISTNQYVLEVKTDISDIYEYNNNISSAKLIPFNTVIYADLDGLDYGSSNIDHKDKDVYKFKITEPGILGINVSDVGPNTKINLEILNEAGENVFSDPCSTVGEGVELFQWSYCDTGYFYLVIKDSNFDNKSGGGSYNFNLQFIPKECNSTIATASKIEIGQTVKSIIKNTVDDYFSFDVTAPIVLDINLKELDDTATVTWKGLTLIDENKKVLWVHTYYKDVDLDAYYDLSICQPGKYYLEVTDNHQQSCISKKTYFAYELTLNTNKIDKYECNNDVASATTINVNENITASVDFFGDKDYYVFPILKNDSLIVDFDITEAQLLKLHLQDANHILPEMTQILKGTNGLHYSVVYPKGGFSGNYILYTEPFNSYSHDDFFYSKN